MVRCLIVDDSLQFLTAARGWLEREGIAVVGVASTIAQALQLVHELHPDVALVDIVPRQQGQGHSIFLLGRYDDQYVKTAQGWKIKSRVLTITSTRELGAGVNAGTK